jgi:hypothetical protein
MIVKKPITKNRFLSSGSYGCVYYPSYNCKGQKIMDKEYVTKLVKNDITAQTEIEIGKKLKKYKNDFILVASSCKILNENLKKSNMATIKTDNLIPKCKLIERNANFNNKYVLLYSKYIKSQEFVDFIENKKIKPTKHELIKYFLIISQKISVLTHNYIIHNDLHFGNLLLDENKKLYIIDFGLSIIYNKLRKYLINNKRLKEKKILNENEKKDLKYIESYISRCIFPYTPTWKFWTLEYHFICYLIDPDINIDYLTNDSVLKIINKVINGHTIIKDINDFFIKNNNYNFIENYKKVAYQFFSKYVNNPKFTNKYDIILDLLQYSYTWDFFKIALHYIEMYDELNINCINFYLLLLIFIHPDPNNRPKKDEYKEYINEFTKMYNPHNLNIPVGAISKQTSRTLSTSIRSIKKIEL